MTFWVKLLAPLMVVTLMLVVLGFDIHMNSEESGVTPTPICAVHP